MGSQYGEVTAKGVPSWNGLENVTAVSAAATDRHAGVNLPSLLVCDRAVSDATAHRRMTCDAHHTSTGDYLLDESVDVAQITAATDMLRRYLTA